MANKADKRPCCLLLKELNQQGPESITYPDDCAELLNTLSQHCVVLRSVGKSKTKIDKEHATCYMAVHPESSQELIDEATKTVAVSPDLEQYYTLLAKINGALSTNIKLQQLTERHRLLLAQVREGERRYGKVPDTSLLQSNAEHNELDHSAALKEHPALKSPQFDGAPSQDNPKPSENPSAPERVQELQLQHRPQPAFNPRPRGPGNS